MENLQNNFKNFNSNFEENFINKINLDDNLDNFLYQNNSYLHLDILEDYVKKFMRFYSHYSHQEAEKKINFFNNLMRNLDYKVGIRDYELELKQNYNNENTTYLYEIDNIKKLLEMIVVIYNLLVECSYKNKYLNKQPINYNKLKKKYDFIDL